MKFKIVAGAEPYTHRAIWLFIANAFFGHGGASIVFPKRLYPDEPSPSGVGKPHKGVPRVMVAYAATMVRRAPLLRVG